MLQSLGTAVSIAVASLFCSGIFFLQPSFTVGAATLHRIIELRNYLQMVGAADAVTSAQVVHSDAISDS